MVSKCCATNCDGNYNAENKVKTFKLQQNPEERKWWIPIIPQAKIPDFKYIAIYLKQ